LHNYLTTGFVDVLKAIAVEKLAYTENKEKEKLIF